ncbi:hypothetical protein FIBSPDRAFT_38438 [Athelia psychrophila]|uniref:Uncharacterized protein n=1 Tax=Athelia psychrophila TaxID=1759441 RepID=A0A166FJK6_9AGAM|nr:hypothetical protein FIBSPDRAFT_38438 [Fibularhizoctonia sp. CBS 109695]
MPPPCSSTHTPAAAIAPSLSLHHANPISRTPAVAHTPTKSAAVVDVAEIVATRTRHDPSTRNRVPTRSNHIAAHPRNVERRCPRSPTRVHTSQDGTQRRPRGRHRRSHDFKPPPQRLRALGPHPRRRVYPALCARANPPCASRPSTLVNSHTDDTPQHSTEPCLHPATQPPSLAPSCPYLLACSTPASSSSPRSRASTTMSTLSRTPSPCTNRRTHTPSWAPAPGAGRRLTAATFTCLRPRANHSTAASSSRTPRSSSQANHGVQGYVPPRACRAAGPRGVGEGAGGEGAGSEGLEGSHAG